MWLRDVETGAVPAGAGPALGPERSPEGHVGYGGGSSYVEAQPQVQKKRQGGHHGDRWSDNEQGGW